MSFTGVLLKDLVFDSLTKHSSSVALEVFDKKITYREMQIEIEKISNLLFSINNDSEFIGIFGDRSEYVYKGILATVCTGLAYVPLNTMFPAERLVYMMDFSKLKTLILCEEAVEKFDEISHKAGTLNILYLGSNYDKEKLESKYRKHKIYFLNDYPKNKFVNKKNIDDETTIYLMFTSGSTGRPKAVPVCNKNIVSYLNTIGKMYQIKSGDRVSQMFDITFDLSVHDIFVSILGGATLCIVPKVNTIGPAKFIKEKEITVWFSVPSVIMYMKKMKMLKEGSFPHLRLSLFCGEALFVEDAMIWQEAAPNSKIENLYGPTETTIAISSYQFNSYILHNMPVVPIGKIFSDHEYMILNHDKRPVKGGEEGLLYITGNQVVAGYLFNEEQTKKSFVMFDDNKWWYNTGDIVKESDQYGLIYIGREDFQLKINGYRVELNEIDSLLREKLQYPLLLSVPENFENNKATGIAIVIEGVSDESVVDKITKICKEYLPDYMNPDRVHFVKQLPLNYNQKFDRKKLIKMIEDGYEK